MNPAVLSRKGTLGVAIVVLAVLTALAVLLAAKPSQAQDVNVITVEPTEVGFGAVEMGTTGDPVRTITVTNTSGALLTIGGVNILGANAGQFSLVEPLPVGGITLDRDGTYDLRVAFSPTSNGTKVANLGFDVVGSGATLPTVNLTGTGTEEPPASQPGAQGCDIVGTNNGETLTGTPGADTICGLGGNDKINGLGANDVLNGGSGNDRITGKSGKDRMLGKGGRDRLNAKDGKPGDLLKGGGGKDRGAWDKRDKVRSM